VVTHAQRDVEHAPSVEARAPTVGHEATLGAPWPAGARTPTTPAAGVTEGELVGFATSRSAGWHLDSADIVDQRRALECSCFVDTLGGDELIAHPGDPDACFVLPRHSNRVLQAGRGMGQALAWLHESGELTAPLGLWHFQPWVAWLHLHAGGSGAEHEAIVGAIESTELVRQRSDASEEEEEEDGPFTTLLLPSIGGVLTVSDASRINLLCDPDANPRSLNSVEAALSRVGCVVGQREPKPAPTYLGLEL
jgi:hypothetical protein